jgi:hypothetical protein
MPTPGISSWATFAVITDHDAGARQSVQTTTAPRHGRLELAVRGFFIGCGADGLGGHDLDHVVRCVGLLATETIMLASSIGSTYCGV